MNCESFIYLLFKTKKVRRFFKTIRQQDRSQTQQYFLKFSKAGQKIFREHFVIKHIKTQLKLKNRKGKQIIKFDSRYLLILNLITYCIRATI